MKGSIIYVKGHEKSEAQARQALASFRRSWDVELVEGVTPETLDDKEWDVSCIEGGRLIGFQQKGERSYLTKKSCLTNHYRLWKKVIEANEPMAFIEQDAICCGDPPRNFAGDVLVLNVDYAFFPPSVLGTLAQMRGYMPPVSLTPTPLPQDFPLKYYKNNVYKDHAMMPGTAAYVVTPKGAKKLLKAADKYGIDQSDFFINNHNVEISYISPSPVKFNTVNLNLSHKL